MESRAVSWGRSISAAKKGVPLSSRNREALKRYWESKKGVISDKRNGWYVSCARCGVAKYKNQRDMKRSKMLFCSKKCAYAFKDEGKTFEQKKIRKSPAYKEWRKHVFQRDDYTCQACGKRGGELQADHELPFASYPDLRLEILNGRTLCIPCHKKTPTYGTGVI